uniref:Uncharacterized protein n=1 Tax=Oryza meridionalis TaxID=40149 RepID=A0A0E0DGW1_9ORYZ
MDRSRGYFIKPLEALEAGGHVLAAVVEDEAEVDGEVELRMRLRSTGRLRLMPRMLPLMAVQRHTAASRSTSPSSSGQHGSAGGTPTLALMRPSTLAHTPSFSASRGHLPNAAGVGVGVDGVDGVGVGQRPPQALANENTTRLTARNSAIEDLPAIAAAGSRALS